ncbi:tol-pal system YbgF family protein [Croceibacterium xixiisoli]|uniref:tetratricopeptide repeat protein n=1 Tax=Croceibacterium xixiisoli TaxID=1476466 RepID=UPI00361AE297
MTRYNLAVRAQQRPSRFRLTLTGLVLAGFGLGAVLPTAAAAQDEARIRKVEAEIRALQRAVFPNGDNRFFTPEVITPNGAQTTQPQIGTPSTTAISDILVRLDALETQVARLTALSEENDNQLNQMRNQIAALTNAQASVPPALNPAPSGVIAPPAGTPTPTPRPAPTPAPTPAPAAAAPTAARLAAVQAIAKPATGDAGDDEYTYGFRLWEAKLYPEAQQQLALFTERYPSHSRISFGRNLLGRAFLDDGKPREAATHFFNNYQADKQGARAADSLLYLASSMISLNDTNRACIALAEFGETYPLLATGRLKADYDANRARVRCS